MVTICVLHFTVTPGSGPYPGRKRIQINFRFVVKITLSGYLRKLFAAMRLADTEHNAGVGSQSDSTNMIYFSES